MRSIHKKTLKRFLSTLLALTMVLGMVPFTALAAPADVTLEQSGLKATITPLEPAAVTAGNQSTVTYTVKIEATTDGNKNDVKLTIDDMDYSFGTVTVGGSPYVITGADNFGPFTLTTDGKITGTVTKNYAPNSYNVPMSLTVGGGTSNGSATFTVPRAADLSLTVPSSAVTAGEAFTVTAESDINNGYIEFTYGTETVTEPVMPRSDGTGYATHTFTAVADKDTVTAKQFGMSGGVVNTEANTSIMVTAAATYYDVTFMVNGLQYGEKQSVKSGEKAIRPVDPLVADGKVFAGWYTDNTFANVFDFATETITANTTVYAKVVDKLTITFLPGAVGAYIPFSPTTVSVKNGTSYIIPADIPTREGYTFTGWKAGTTTYAYDSTAGTFTPAAIPVSGSNVTLNAQWAAEMVNITHTDLTTVDGVNYVSAPAASVVKGSTVYFTIQLDDGYDPSTLMVKAGDVALNPVRIVGAANQYQYSFVANAATAVTVTGPSKLAYTVMMPVGHFDAKITAVNGSTITPAASASVEHGGSYTFTVTPATGYALKGVYVNGVAQTGDSSYTVTNVTSAQTVEVVVDAIPSYTVTYVVNDAQYTTQKVTSGQQIGTLPDAPVVDGYTFDGWYTQQNGVGTAVTDTTTFTNDTTVYAKLTAKTYTITYDKNAGSETVGNMPLTTTTKTHGTAVALASEIPTRTGYAFLGWGTTAAATTATYQPGDMYSTEGSITLYAVWQINTFTVTLPNGTGYTAMPTSTSSSPVNYNGSFTFTVTVDPEYAVATPVVKANNVPLTTADTSSPYTYTIDNITTDQVVSIQVTRNEVHTVTFMVNGSVYQTQQVEHNAKATVPNPPSVEGYTFGGWYVNLSDTTAYNFGTSVTADLTLNAKMTAITPEVTWTANGTGWTLTDVVLSDTSTAVANNSTVAYKSSIDFKVIVAKGYDATNLAVAANGLALNPVLVTENPDGTTTYSFMLSNITADQKITVTGVARKMITITYNDNGGIGGPGQEQVKYYLSDTDCDKISLVEPTRVGYTFLGWATTNDAAAAAYSNPVKYDGSTPLTSDIANFTTDTTLYAVWSAKTTTVSLTVDKTSQYEGENVVLTAEVKSGSTAVTSGSVQFYRYTGDPTSADYDVAANWKLLDSKVLSGGKATLTIATSAYQRGGQNKDSYKAVFVPDEGAGYSTASSTDSDGTTPAPKVTVTVLSTAISWKLNASSEVDTDANELTIKNSSGTEVDSMTAGQEYTLELPAIYALDETTYNDTTKLVVNKDYKVTWQFRNASGTWEDYTAAAGTNSVKILAEYSQYVFRAVVTPLTGATGHFTQAAKYNAATTTTPATLIANQYEAYLVTETTPEVEQQQTTTKLKVSNTNNIGPTVAQFEGQKVTLTATVVLKDTTTKVTTGEVYFYNGATLIGKADVQSDGTAVLEATISEYNRAVTDQKDTFKAVYQNNATYKTSTSDSKDVLIRSTAIVWAKDTSGAEVKTLTVTPTGSIYADNQYTLTLPAIKEEGQDVTLTVGTDYVVSWYMVKADKTVVLLAENTESNTYTVVPPTAGVTYYAVVSPKAGSNYTDAYEGGETKNFLTSAETAASVKAPTITTITFGEVLTDTGKTPDFSQYEEKTITITAKVVEADLTNTTTAKTPEEVVKSGTVTFYVVTTNGTNVVIGTAAVDNSGQATVDYTLPEFSLATTETLDNIEYFFAMYTDTVGTYADSNTTDVASSAITDPLTAAFGVGVTGSTINNDTEAVQILSTSISWKLDGDNKIVAASATTTDANKLKVYAGDTTAASALVSDGKMTAGSTYTLELPAVYALDDAKSTTPTALTVNVDYTVVWQYREFGASDWNNYPIEGVGNTVLITPTYSGYQFQAVVTPIYDNEHLTGYKTAAAYDSSDVATGKTKSLITDPTEKTELQKTTTALEITGADNEGGDVKINGATPFSTIGDHKAQFEGQKVTLEATVKETSTGTPAVTTGYVNFYRYGTTEPLNTTPVEVGANGVATFEVTISAYDTTAGVTANVDRFYAVYLVNDTYDTSASVTKSGTAYSQPGDVDSVWIKSTAIKTPVIDSVGTVAPTGKLNGTDATYTSYAYDLEELLAGVEHKFTLRETGAEATGLTSDWSVVALDGRTVASTDYTIQWLVTTGTNEEKAANNETAATFVVNESKSGDKYRVKLVPTADGDMKTGATSNYVVIGTKQDVNVTVTASDEIASTTDTDVYQLNEITLTATVTAKESDATVKPSGTVAFYYENNGSWVKLGEAVLAVDTDGRMRASIDTTKLPVTDGTNVKRDVKITAVYLGDVTFKVSGNYNESTEDVTAGTGTGTTGNGVTDKTVTVYSSVVLVYAAEENKAVTSLTNGGIHISAEDGKVLANETNVNLKLSDIYTLDYADALSKLVDGVDYTVQWQKLVNAAAYSSNYASEEAVWDNITGATNTTCQITVEQGAAYRAVITVKDTPIAKGSYTFVDQGTLNTVDNNDGRQVYYSNVLVAGSGNLDLTVTTNTSDTRDGFEGIVEGEIVTINTFASGATNTTPISELTVTVTKQDETDPVFEKVKTDVNGYTSFDWATTAPGYYTLKVKAVPSNGYAPETVTRTLIVRDNNYGFNVTDDSKVYNGKAQGIDLSVTDMGIEEALAQNSVVVYYYSDEARTQMVEPSDAGTYYATIRLQESAYWTEKTENVTFTITKRPVSVVDLVAQAKVYDGTTDANLQEIVLNDAAVNATTGLPTGDTGVLNGDSIYAIGTGKTSSAAAGPVTLNVIGATLMGDDKDNYTLDGTYAGEAFVIQRNQLKGDIADATYAYTGSSITVPADDIAVIDQQGNNFTDYTVTYYYHNGDGVEKVNAMKALGLYTVVVTPNNTNYKGGAAQKVYVAAAAVDAAPASLTSLTLDITNTVVTYTGTPVGVTVKDSQGNTVTNVTYNGSTTVPTAAGRYLVKATASTGDTAYGLYTIVKADPALSLSASDADYNSALQTGSPVLTGAPDADQVYYTWTGGTIQGVSYTAPTEVGKYVVTAHVNETANNTAHEVSDTFEIKPVTLTITADSYQRHQYGEYPQMTATFSGLATDGVAPDTSLRDVQIQPEFLFSGDNDALDQVGNYTVKPVSALARNYTVEYVDGLFTVTQVDGNPELAICGMISNGNGDKTIAYYGDEIQLYAYGSQKNNVINNSSIWTWDIKSGNATITPEGLLTFGKGNQDVTVRLTRGIGTQSIYTEITIHVLKQEVKVIVPELDVTYSAASQDYTTSKTLQAVNAKGEQKFASNSSFVIAKNTRTDIGTQVVTGKVADTIVSYQSETYGGRFTVNDKDVTVTPTAQIVIYGNDLSIVENAFTTTGEVGSVDPLTDTNVASVRELYNNLDVANQYEILVTGTENINYNVKYVTAPTAPQVTVNDKALTVKTGVYANKIGQTSGSLNPVGEYPNDDRLAFSASDLTSFTKDTTRMYGEPNQVMGYVLETLVDGDSEADLTALLDWLVKYDFNIAGHASVKYSDKTTQLTTSATPDYQNTYDPSYATTIATKGNPAAADSQRIDSSMDLVNYTENYVLGTQNIYQRPVELKCNISDANKELPKSTSKTALDQILIQNITAGKLSGEGGLATLLKHTIANLDLKITYQFSTDGGATWTPAPADFDKLTGYNKVKATISVGNPDYYAVPIDVEFTVSPTRYIIEIVSFGQTSASVNLYEYNEDTDTKTLTWFPADSALAAGSASTAMTCKIYNRVDSATKYADYAYETPVVDAKMRKGYTTGNYTISYSALVGSFRMFAIADGYIIIDNT